MQTKEKRSNLMLETLFTFIFHRRPIKYMVENKGKSIQTEIFPSVQKHEI